MAHDKGFVAQWKLCFPSASLPDKLKRRAERQFPRQAKALSRSKAQCWAQDSLTS